MILRLATPSDATAVADLERALLGVDAWSEAVVLSEIEGPGRHAVVAVEGEEVVGYAVTLASSDLVDLQRIAVRDSHQRRGIAGRLLDEVAAAAREVGADRMLLEVSATNSPALAFYASAGFVEIDRRRRYYRDGSDAVVMRHSLKGASRQERMET